MKQIKRKFYRIFAFAFFLILIWNIPVQPVYATEADIHFGSAWYEPAYETDFPIGLYIDSTEKIGTYEIIAVYDPHFLLFKGGAELVEEGKIRISGNLQENSTKIMLDFHMLSVGNTVVSVDSAVIYSADGLREFDVHTLPSAPIKMKSDDKPPYTEMTVNGIKIDGFTPDVTEYEIELEFAENFEVDIKEAEAVTVDEAVKDDVTRLLHISAEDSTGRAAAYLLTVHLLNIPEVSKEEQTERDPDRQLDNTDESVINEENTKAVVGDISEKELKKKIEMNRREAMIKAVFILGLLIIIMIVLGMLPLVIGSQSEKKRTQDKTYDP